MRAKLFVALCWVWGAIIVAIGVNLVSSYIQDSVISFLIHYAVWVAAGFVSITGLTLWTWKDYRFAEAKTHFELVKEARELLPADLDFQEHARNEKTDLPRPYNKTYIPRRAIPLDADPDIEPGYEEPALRQLIRDGKGFVFLGQPGAGKTRTLFDLVGLMAGYTVVKPKMDLRPPESAFFIFKDRRVVLFLNDLDKYEDIDPQELHKKIERHAVSCAIAATCRDGNDLRKVTNSSLRHFYEDYLLPLRLVRLTQPEQQRLAASVGEVWEEEYATPGDIVMKKMREIMQLRFHKDLSPDCQDVLRALKLMDKAGLSPTAERLKAVLPVVFDKSPHIMDCLRTLADQSFVDGRALPAKIHPEPYYLNKVVPYEQYQKDDPTGDFPLLITALEANKDADGLFALGRTFFAGEDRIHAHACFDKVATLRSDFAETLRKEADAAHEKRRYPEAMEMYDYLLLLQPGDAIAWDNKGVCLHAMGRHDEALAAFDQATTLQPDQADAWTNKGICLRTVGRYDEALAAHDRATTLQPDYADMWTNKGNCLSAMGRYEDALIAHNQATDLQPDLAAAWTNKGNCLHAMKRYEDALIAHNQATDLQPGDAIAWTNKGICLHVMDRHDEALAAHDRATTLQPDYAAAWGNKGSCLHVMGRYEDALRAYDQVIHLNPDDATAWAQKGHHLADHFGRYHDALSAYDRATDLQPDLVAAWSNKGVCLRAMGRHEEALVACRRVMELDPPDPRLWRGIARTAEACGDRIMAEKATLRALELEREQGNTTQRGAQARGGQRPADRTDQVLD